MEMDFAKVEYAILGTTNITSSRYSQMASNISPNVTNLKSEGGGIADRIMDSFQPVIELCQGLSFPLAFVCISAGFLLLMVGQTTRGVKMLKWAGIGYIGLMFVPSIMSMLFEVGKAIAE